MILLNKTRSLLDELDSLRLQKDKENVVQNRANHILMSTINLFNFIRENYDKDQADELERRFVNSIRSKDTSKFTRGLQRIIEENKVTNKK